MASRPGAWPGVKAAPEQPRISSPPRLAGSWGPCGGSPALGTIVGASRGALCHRMPHHLRGDSSAPVICVRSIGNGHRSPFQPRGEGERGAQSGEIPAVPPEMSSLSARRHRAVSRTAGLATNVTNAPRGWGHLSGDTCQGARRARPGMSLAPRHLVQHLAQRSARLSQRPHVRPARVRVPAHPRGCVPARTGDTRALHAQSRVRVREARGYKPPACPAGSVSLVCGHVLVALMPCPACLRAPSPSRSRPALHARDGDPRRGQ